MPLVLDGVFKENINTQDKNHVLKGHCMADGHFHHSAVSKRHRRSLYPQKYAAIIF